MKYNSIIIYCLILSVSFIIRIDTFANISPIHKSNTQIQYKFILPDYHLDHRQWIPNWGMTSDKGKPQLPQTGFLFQSDEPISIDIIDIQETNCYVDDIAPAPVISENRFVYAKDRQTYETDQFYPSSIFQIDPPSKWGNTDVVRILIRPFQWNPVTNQLKIIHQMIFSINWTKKVSCITEQNNFNQIDPIKSQLIMNYSPRKRNPPALKKKSSGSSPKLNISIPKNAIYGITYRDLEKHHFPVTDKPVSYLQLWHNDKQRPLNINAKSSYMQDGDFLTFYGQATESPYTNINVYQLFWGDSMGMRMSIKDASSTNQNAFAPYAWHTAKFEKNFKDYFWPATPGAPETDFVYWDLLVAPDTFSTTFDLPGITLLPQHIASQLGIVFQEKTNSFHKIQIWVNNQNVFQNQFHTDSLFHVDITLDTGILKSQDNTITIQTELSTGYKTDQVYLNKLSIRYPVSLIAQNDMAIFETDHVGQNFDISGFTTQAIRIFDISNPALPIELTGGIISQTNTTYHVQFYNSNSNMLFACTDSTVITPEIRWASSEQLQSTERAANYIIITPKKFVPAVQPLLDYYTGMGMRTMVVSPDAIYDIFNGGNVHPQAIRTFLSYAFHNWTIPPEYVLLVGDSNIDYMDYFQTGKQNEVPVYLTYMDSVGLAPNDHYYVCIDGDDLYPDMAIGRLPGANVSDIEKMVSKRLRYSKNVNTARQRNLFISDNHPNNLFTKICENSLGFLSDKMEQVHLQLNDSPNTATLIEQMFYYLNHGTLIATYIGHGSIDTWAGEPILHSNDINRINPDSPLTFFVSLNCMSGYFALPDRYSLSQNLILPENKGAIAVFSPTALAQTWEIDILARSLFSLIRSNPTLPVGDLIMGAKMAAYAKDIRDLSVQMFTLTGDPLVRLNIPITSIIGDIDADRHLTLKDILLLLKHLGILK